MCALLTPNNPIKKTAYLDEIGMAGNSVSPALSQWHFGWTADSNNKARSADRNILRNKLNS